MSKQYVAGFLINPSANTIAVIRKQRPHWQRNKFNAIGGKINNGESPREAMAREFEEETGVRIEGNLWQPLCTLQGHKVTAEDTDTQFTVYFFFRLTTLHLQTRLHSTTDEEVTIMSLSDRAWLENAIPNLSWLIPMALSMPRESASSFDIVERY